MSSRIADHIRRNVYGLIAIFIALSGTAYAVDGPLAGQNQVGSADIINGEVGSRRYRGERGHRRGSSRRTRSPPAKIVDGEVGGRPRSARARVGERRGRE